MRNMLDMSPEEFEDLCMREAEKIFLRDVENGGARPIDELATSGDIEIPEPEDIEWNIRPDYETELAQIKTSDSYREYGVLALAGLYFSVGRRLNHNNILKTAYTGAVRKYYRKLYEAAPASQKIAQPTKALSSLDGDQFFDLAMMQARAIMNYDIKTRGEPYRKGPKIDRDLPWVPEWITVDNEESLRDLKLTIIDLYIEMLPRRRKKEAINE